MDPKDQQTLLLAYLKENCDQARHHEIQRERVTAIVASTTGLIILGTWGYLAAWKHHERSRLHVQRIRECRKQLQVLSGVDLDALNAQAYQEHLARFGRSVLYESRTHLIWKAFPIIVSLIGVAVAINILLQFK